MSSGSASGAARRRMLVAGLAGLAAAGAVAALGPWQLVVLVGFDSWAITQVVWIVVKVSHLDGAQTRVAAQIEDDSRAQANTAINVSGLASLVGVFLALSKARQVGPVQAPLLTLAALTTVVLAWVSVHTVFTLRYAHLYYATGEVGGIDFGEATGLPDYHDFAYLGFTVGMTYQVSDTNITDRMIRRTVLRHALVSFVFATVIIGLTINVMAGFVR